MEISSNSNDNEQDKQETNVSSAKIKKIKHRKQKFRNEWLAILAYKNG